MADVRAAKIGNARFRAPVARDLFFIHLEIGLVGRNIATPPKHQAFDAAAFLNSQPRPEMPNLAQDYPDRTTKPVDNSYGPFADGFPLNQHRYGPFGPIEGYYKKLKGK